MFIAHVHLTILDRLHQAKATGLTWAQLADMSAVRDRDGRGGATRTLNGEPAVRVRDNRLVRTIANCRSQTPQLIRQLAQVTVSSNFVASLGQQPIDSGQISCDTNEFRTLSTGTSWQQFISSGPQFHSHCIEPSLRGSFG